MSIRISISPHGRLHGEVAQESSDQHEAKAGERNDPALAALVSAFRHSSADGLLTLVRQHGLENLPAEALFWRDWSRQFFHRLCQLPEAEMRAWGASHDDHLLAPPDELSLAVLVSDAPPMHGLEYLTPQLLRTLWSELAEWTRNRSRDLQGGVSAFLREVNPQWHLVGRVTFHLAENKRDESRPFAFLATYSHRLSQKAKVQHLPLAEALKQYAGERNQSKLAELLSPVRAAAEQSSLVRELLMSRELFHAQAWPIDRAYQFLRDVPAMEQAGLVVRVPNWWNPRRPPRPQVQVRIGERPASQIGFDGLLDFSLDIALDGDPLTDTERTQILQASDGLVLLRGKWIEVDGDQLQSALLQWQRLQDEHAQGLTFLQGMRLLAGAPLDDADSARATPEWSGVVAGSWLQETLAKIRSPDGIVECEPGRGLQATLRPYQVEGVRWLWFMSRLGLGACLADDMGLGKTIQVIDLILRLKSPRSAATPARASRDARSTGPGRPHLLIVPASLVGNWKSEWNRFAPQVKVYFAHHSETDASSLKRLAKDPASELSKFDVVVTTYTFARNADWLRHVAWDLIVLDEAQLIKNASSAQSKAVKSLRANGRILLTGTPVENHLGDLWSLFDFCCPGLLGSSKQFRAYAKKLSTRDDAHAYASLRKLVRPYLLRRLKSDPAIVPDLPEKTEMHVECGLSKKQAVLYERSVNELQKQLDSVEGIQRRGVILALLLRLKQICNHPSQYLDQPVYHPADSGKFLRLAQVCQPMAERQEKVLVFTQFQSICEPLAEYLHSVFGQPGLVLHGGVAIGKRKDRVRRFQEREDLPFFVISVKAGGTGLNLTAASHVVHFDRWWNPAVENQATDRAFRIGQKRNVLVHKFVCRGTVEARIDEMIRGKQNLAEQVLGAGGEALLTEMTDRELLQFVSLDIHRSAVDD